MSDRTASRLLTLVPIRRTNRGPDHLVALVLSLLLVIASVLPAGAQSPSAEGLPASSPVPTPLAGTTWLLDQAGSPAVASVAVTEAVVTLRIADAVASGAAGCNGYSSEVQVDGMAISFGPVATTMMLCEDPIAALEAAYLAELSLVARYGIVTDTLALLDGSGSPRLVYRAVAPSAVVGSWTVTGIRAGETVLIQPEPAAPLTLDLGLDGTARGWTGCDAVTGAYLVAGDAIRIGALASTATECLELGASIQEWYYLDALDRARTWTVSDSVLTLIDETGEPLLAFSAGTTGTLTASWRITGAAGPDGMLPVVEGSSPRLDLFANGTLFGWTGCNSIVTTYHVSGGGVLEIGPLGVNGVVCPSEELAVQDAAIRAGLVLVTGWQIDAPGIALIDATGAVRLTLLGIGPTPAPSPGPSAAPSASPTATIEPTPEPTPSSVAVPDVVDMTEADALVEIGAAGLTAGERTRAYSGSVKSGRIISTDPRAGVVVSLDTAIDFVVSRGPKPSPSPTAKPTAKPTPKPTAKPTARPTAEPTPMPTPPPTLTPPDLLEGTSWVLTDYRDEAGDVIDLPPGGTLPTATFQDGLMSGSTGCNPYSTTYQISDVARITLGTVVTDGAACAEPDGTMEALFLGALATTDRFTLSDDGPTLRLRGPSGTPVLYFAPLQP